MKKSRQKIMAVVLSCILALCVLACAATLLVLHFREETLAETQNEAIQELYDNKGSFDERSIVLANTSKPQAKELAKALNATLRMTKDGRFATLTLPEDVTVFDVYENDEYRRYLKYFSLDYEARISDFVTNTESEDGELNERLPARPLYSVNDPAYAYQSYLDYLNLQQTWDTKMGAGIRVAVIDTGIDTDHPEFSGRISPESYNASEDKVVKDYLLADKSYDWSLIEDENGHGTAVAGVIGAAMDGAGIVGIAPRVELLVIKAECDENGVFRRMSDLVFGLHYAIDQQVTVVNMSFGSEAPDDPFEKALQYAEQQNVLCVAAAGNASSAALTWPAANDTVIGVGALDSDSWTLAPYSNYGDNVNIVAPGTVYTTKMSGEYGTVSGTSFAAPMVTAALALLSDFGERAPVRDTVELLYSSCYDIGKPGLDGDYGYGALDVGALILKPRVMVTFDMLTDEVDSVQKKFLHSSLVLNLPAPERSYFVFDGWYFDPQCTQAFIPGEDQFFGDTTLYAKWANEDKGLPYTYSIQADGTVEILSYTGHQRYITIPDFIEGKPVTSIGREAFKNNVRLREIQLPKHLKKIEGYAFYGCLNLSVAITIPDTVTEIGKYAFYDAVRLPGVIFGNDSQLESIGDYAFSGCAKIRSFTVPAKVTRLNATAFYRTRSLVSFDVHPDNTNFSDRDQALYNFTGNSLICYPAGIQGSYTLPDNVLTIGDLAFAHSKLEAIELSEVSMIGHASFENCSLLSVTIPDSVTSMGSSAFSGSSYLRSVKIGKGLTYIPAYAFCETALASVEIPAGIRTIEEGAFTKTYVLQTITFEDGSNLTHIGSQAFFKCRVTALCIPASVVTIDNYAFAEGGRLTSVTFEAGSLLQTLGDEVFYRQDFLSEILLPEGLMTIGEGAFAVTGLRTVQIPANVSHIGGQAFVSCSELTHIYVDAGNEHYQDVDGVLYNADGTVLVVYPIGNERSSFTVPDGVETIYDGAFYGVNHLTGIQFNQGLKYIGASAFKKASGLESIVLPDSVERLGPNCFASCKATNYTLSKGLLVIEELAFERNRNLKSISIPDSVQCIERYAFASCDKLTQIRFGENSSLQTIKSAAFRGCGITSFRVPSSVARIDSNAFLGCEDLKTVTFAKNSQFRILSANVFSGCSSLHTITFENGSKLTSIEDHGLEGLKQLKNIRFGNAKLQNVGDFAFRFCESLTTLKLPSGLTRIGKYAFYECINLSDVYLPATVDTIGRFAFLRTNKLTVYLASASLPLHLEEDWDYGISGYYLGVLDGGIEGDWKYAMLPDGNIAIIEYLGEDTYVDMTALDLGADIVSIGAYSFAYSSVETIILPETLTVIPAEAFCGSALTSIEIPAEVVFIGRYAFANTPLTAVTFAPDSRLHTIEKYAFENTEMLEGVVIPSTVTSLGRGVFKNSGIRSLVFADGFSMATIPEDAFSYTHISSLSIPDSVTKIDHNAFREIKELKSISFGNGQDLMVMSNAFYRTGLESLHIPANVTYIGEFAFTALPKLTAYTVAEDNPYYKAQDGLLVSKDGFTLIAVPAGMTGSMTLPQNIEVISFGAFEDSKLNDIRFHDDANILSIGYRAFYNADGLSEIHITDSVVSVDFYAFGMCDGLHTVTFGENSRLKIVYEGTFYNCSNLQHILLPDSVKEISDYAFYGCGKLGRIPVSENTQLRGVYDYSFAYAGIEGDFVVPDYILDIGEYAFQGNLFTSLYMGNEDLYVGIGAFADCPEITEITICFIGGSGDSQKNTGLGYIFGANNYDDEFRQIYTQENETIPPKLKKVVLLDGITVIPRGAFFGLSQLEEIVVPHSVQVVCNDAFSYTTARYSLTNEIEVDDKYINSHYMGSGFEGYLTIIGSLSGELTEVGSYAFESCENMTGITLPDSIEKIGYHAFNQTGIISIDLPDNLSLIEEYTFFNSALTSIHLPASLRAIGSDAFLHCDNLTYIQNDSDLQLYCGSDDYGMIALNATLIVNKNGDLSYVDQGETYFTVDEQYLFRGKYSYYLVGYLGPEDTITLPARVNGKDYEVESLGKPCEVIIPEGFGEIDFCDCKDVTRVVLPNDLTSIDRFAFDGCSNLRSVVIPEGVTSIGYGAFEGCQRLSEIELPDSLTEIGDYAFSDCTSLTSIVIPDGVTAIGAHTFSECTSLTSIVIPDSVVKIGDWAFSECTSLVDVHLPEGMVEIGGRAFSECAGLTSLHVPDSVVKIGSRAFWGCAGLTDLSLPASLPIHTGALAGWPGLTNVSIPDGVTRIENDAFSDCTGLVSIHIPDSVTFIGDRAFANCINLTSVRIPDSVTHIGDNAFESCKKLASIRIPDGVTYIGYYAFAYCDALESMAFPGKVSTVKGHTFLDCYRLTDLTIGDGVTGIENAFMGCTALRELYIPASVSSLHTNLFKSGMVISIDPLNTHFRSVNGVLYNSSMTKLIYVPDSVTEIVFPASVTDISAIRDHAGIQTVSFEEGAVIQEACFSNCVSLEKVDLPDGLVRLADYAFVNCSKLTEIALPDSIEYLGWSTFAGCSGLVSVSIPPKVTTIPNRAFASCTGLTNVIIPSGVTKIDNYAFEGCVGLMSITIPDTVTVIGADAFRSTGLVRVEIPDSVTSLGGYTFQNCKNLQSVKVSKSITAIPNHFLDECSSLRSFTIPEGVTSIERDAFSGCSALSSITVPDSVSYIGEYAFYECDSLLSVTLPAGITRIPNRAFYGCTSLMSLVIPDSVTEIEGYAFAYCENLIEVTLGQNLIEIGGYAFDECRNLLTVNNRSDLSLTFGSNDHGCVAFSAITITDKDGNTSNRDGSTVFYGRTDDHFIFKCQDGQYTLLAYVGDQETVTLPKDIDGHAYSIYKFTCMNDTAKHLVIPEGVMSVDAYAFYECETLVSISIPDGVTSIGDYAFYKCKELVSINLPGNVTSIGESAFYDCSSLTEAVLPDGLTRIGDYAFSGCTSLTGVELPDSLTTVGRYAFQRCHALQYVYVPAHIQYGYGVWYDCTSLTRVDLDPSMKVIPAGLVSGCTNLKSIVLPADLTTIEYDAFAYTGLTGIAIPNGVTAIGGQSFRGCKGITDIILPKGLTEISNYAFAGAGLISVDIPDGVRSIGERAFMDCLSLFEIHIPDSVTYLDRSSFKNTAYCADPDNWDGAGCYIGKHLVQVSPDAVYFVPRPDTVSIAIDAFDGCTQLRNLYITCKEADYSLSTTPLETLILSYMSDMGIYWEYRTPDTLKNVILTKDVRMNRMAFHNLTDVTIFVQASEKDVRWDENFPNWHNGNKVVYIGDWITTDFRDQNGKTVLFEVLTTNRVIHTPHLSLEQGQIESEYLVGWDLDHDGIADSIPATSTKDIVANAIIEKRSTEYVVLFYDADGKTLLSKQYLTYGSAIIPPAVPSKQGYTVQGWFGYSMGMTVTEDCAFTLIRSHNGNGHVYGDPICIPPTCTDEGYMKRICGICGECLTYDHVSSLGHSYVTEETKPTCVADGMIRYSCVTCGHQEDEILPNHGHFFVETSATPSTCTHNGEIHYTCKTCGVKTTSKAILKPHEYQSVATDMESLAVLIERIPYIFFGYEGATPYYLECKDCRYVLTVREGMNQGGSAGILSTSCNHILTDWQELVSGCKNCPGIDVKACTVCELSVEFRLKDGGDDHDYFSVTVDPTCTENGKISSVCRACGYSHEDIAVPALGHDYATETVKPTCTDAGYTRITCSRCGDSHFEEVNALGHDYRTETVEPTCTEDGRADHTCARCGESYSEILVTPGHDYRTETVEPTCTEDGRADHTCSRCGDCYSEIFEAPGHDYRTETVEPTCTQNGRVDHICSRCQDSYSEVLAATGHKIDMDNIDFREATCMKPGYLIAFCKYCHVVMEEFFLPVSGHSNITEVVEPTCTEQGYTKKSCRWCGKISSTSTVDPLGHDYKVTVKAPTCTEKGYTTHTCTRCGNICIDSEVAELEHTASGWIVDTEPAPGMEGHRHKECIACGEILENEAIEALPAETDSETETETDEATETETHEATETETHEVTETETHEVTEKPVDTEAPTASESNGNNAEHTGKGCSGVVPVDYAGVILLAALCFVFAATRKKDELC